MSLSILGEFLDYDPKSNVLYLKLDFLEPEEQSLIENAVIEKKRTRLKFNLSFRQSKKDQYRKMWYGSLRKISQSDQYKMEPFSENLDDLDSYLRESIFPVRKRLIGNEEVPRVARMRHLSDKELDRCVKRLHDRYSYLTINGNPIDFTDLKQ